MCSCWTIRYLGYYTTFIIISKIILWILIFYRGHVICFRVKNIISWFMFKPVQEARLKFFLYSDKQKYSWWNTFQELQITKLTKSASTNQITESNCTIKNNYWTWIFMKIHESWSFEYKLYWLTNERVVGKTHVQLSRKNVRRIRKSCGSGESDCIWKSPFSRLEL